MVVGVDELLAGDFISSSGDNLVDVHVGLGAASGLPYGKGEMGVQLPLQDFVADLRNDLKTSFVQLPQTMVCHGGGLL